MPCPERRRQRPKRARRACFDVNLTRRHEFKTLSPGIFLKTDLPPTLDRIFASLCEISGLKGEREAAILDRGVNIRVRAAVLWRAHGRCQMCGRTISQHGVVLVVDHKISLKWGGSNDEENLWALCETCLTRLKAHCKTAAVGSARNAFLLPTARARAAALLKTKRGRAIPACLLKAVLGCKDWARCVRSLRSDGWKIVALRSSGRKDDKLTRYMLVSTQA